MTNHLEKNIQQWSATDPKNAVLLPYAEDPKLKFCKTAKGELNLQRGDETFHDPRGAAVEAKEHFEKLELDNIRVLYIYGVGLGYFYEAAKSWLEEKKERHLVFLEDDLGVIHRLFETPNGAKLLEDPQVTLFYFQEIKTLGTTLELLLWHFVKAKILVSALPFYAHEKFQDVHHEVVHETVMRNATIDEYLRYGASFYHNFYYNMQKLSDSYLGNAFFGTFPKVPAIICGAGPSLEKNVHLLRGVMDKALIFAGGSAMNALNSKGIMPHFGAGIDPNAPQYDRMVTNTAFEVPYFYRNRMYWEAFSLIHGPRLYVTGSGGYEVSKWFDQEFGWEEEEIDEGHNVVNFCVEIAQRMGCNPIIFVGVDLAFTKMEAYAKGIVDETGVEVETLFAADDFDEIPLKRKDIDGESIYTLWKWIAESEWLSDYGKEHPLISLINSTEGGLGFPDVPNIPLEEAIKKYCTKNYDLQGRIHGEIQNGSCPHVTDERVHHVLQEIKGSLQRSLEHIKILLQENQKLQKKPTSLETGLAVLAQTELEEEPAYTYILEVFAGISSMLLNYEFRKLKASSFSEDEKRAKQLKLTEKKLRYVHDAALVNLELMKNAGL